MNLTAIVLSTFLSLSSAHAGTVQYVIQKDSLAPDRNGKCESPDVCGIRFDVGFSLGRHQGFASAATADASAKIQSEPFEVSAAEFSVPLAAMDTWNGLRNKHMRNAFEADKFPNITFKFSSAAATTEPLSETPLAVELKGLWQMHGVTREIVLPVKLEKVRGTDVVHVQGDFFLSLKDYNVKVPSFLGLKVEDRVSVHLNFNLKPGTPRLANE